MTKQIFMPEWDPIGDVNRRISLKPKYDMPAESRAYDHGWQHGISGKAIAYNQLQLTYPNAYHKGYWEGVADREQDEESLK